MMQKNLIYCLVLLMLVSIVSSLEVGFGGCEKKSKGFGTVNIHRVQINPCENRARCVFRKNTNVTIDIDFTPTVGSSQAVTADVLGVLRKNYQISLPSMDSDACKSLSCPLVANTRQTYTYRLFIQSSYPSRKYLVKWILRGAPFNMCLIIPIQIDS